MVNTLVSRTPLGASTTNRKWYCDVQDPAVPGVWVPFMGLGEIKPKPSDPTQQDDSDMDGGGYKSSTVTALTWGLEGKAQRKTKTSDPTAYDPGQEIVRKAALKMGTGNRIPVRYYEMEPSGPRVEAYQGFALATWSPDGGGMDALDTVSWTLVGQGQLVAIVHPEGATAVPVIAAFGAPGKAVGGVLAITGAYFTGVTASQVTIGGVAMTAIEVVNDGLINATLPAGTAGSQPVVVNGSAPKSYVRA